MWIQESCPPFSRLPPSLWHCESLGQCDILPRPFFSISPCPWTDGDLLSLRCTHSLLLRSSSSRLSHGCVLFSELTSPSLPVEPTLTTVMLSANNTRALPFPHGHPCPQPLSSKLSAELALGGGGALVWAGCDRCHCELCPLRDEWRGWLHAFQSLVGFSSPHSPCVYTHQTSYVHWV